MPTSAPGSNPLPGFLPACGASPRLGATRFTRGKADAGRAFRAPLRRLAAGFTLLEILVVLAIIAFATAGVTLSMRDPSETQLEREASRLAALLEAARGQSRASGIPVAWRSTPEGFAFDGLPPGALPTRWLDAGTGTVSANPILRLGPDPLIGRQEVAIAVLARPDRVLRIGTDGLRPFSVLSPPAP